ncbi:ribonuclease J [Candidatus Woesearchaeota archaeon]|nr:ribonuclease J [Candidatus Woesearchaeota archaeon]|tara:strand:- start:3515 stop:4840 length:1326 start_codon:yes stop_codon:yes gene_type:complete
MPVEICTVSGYSEFGKNMTAIRYENEVVILDMGIQPEKFIKFTEDEEDFSAIRTNDLVKAGAIPDVSPIKDWAHLVKAIVPSHAHLDHCGSIIYLADNYNAPVLCTPFTAEVIRSMIKDREIKFKNKISIAQPNGMKKISKNITVEFIHTTHSTPQSSTIAIHTPGGIVVYTGDFKFDLTPVLGKPPNIKRLKALGKENVVAMITESTYGDKPGRTPSETVAKDMLTDAVETAAAKKNAIIVTTFSSHLARLKSIVGLGQKHGKKIVFLGRSMAKYIDAGEKTNLISFSKSCEIVKYGSKVEKKLRQIEKHGKHRYLLICTGHQGEPKSVLSRMITSNFLDAKDYVIFSCKTIPTPTNIANRERLERELRRLGIHVMTDVHQSGHGAQDELKEMIEMVKPAHIITSHGSDTAKRELKKLIKELNYKENNIHVSKDGESITV